MEVSIGRDRGQEPSNRECPDSWHLYDGVYKSAYFFFRNSNSRRLLRFKFSIELSMKSSWPSQILQALVVNHTPKIDMPTSRKCSQLRLKAGKTEKAAFGQSEGASDCSGNFASKLCI